MPQLVGPDGLLSSKIALVGEQPAKYEVRYGKPFMGPAGRNLNECLMNARISRGSCYLTNVIKDVEFELKHYLDIKSGVNGRANISVLGQRYLEVLRDELNKTKANVIVAMGNTSLFALTGRVGITAWRGSILESTLLPGRKVIPTLHPAIYTDEKVLANPAAYLAKYLITLDFKKIRTESEFPDIRLTDRKLRTQPSYYECISWLEECKQVAENGGIIYYDIELTPKTQELSCISFATNEIDVLCIPFVDANGDYFSAEQEYELMLSIENLLGNDSYIKGGQNIVFDSHFLLRKYGIRTRNIKADTMIAQHILYPDFGGKTYRGKTLEFITAMWTDIPYYKRDGKLWLTGVGEYSKGWAYNCLDSIACADAFPKQLAELEERGNYDAYERQIKLVGPLSYMMERGIRIDREGMDRAARNARLEADELTQQAYSIMNTNAFNLASPQQVCEYFYTNRGLAPYLSKIGKPTVDEEALTRIANKGFKEASLILEVRRLQKKASTFLNVENVDDDGRMRCSYNPVGTRFSRISSSANIFGTGCLLPRAEVFTKSGWIRLDELKEDTEVLQWDTDWSLSWCVPKIHVTKNSGKMIRANSTLHRNCYTLDHRIPTVSHRNKFIVKPAYEAVFTGEWRLPIGGEYKSGKISWPAIRLLAVIQADGSIEGNSITFQFKKKEKIARFLVLMEIFGIQYNEHRTAYNGYRRFYLPVSECKEFIELLNRSGRSKLFDSWLLRFDQQSLSSLLDEISHWDAHRRGTSFWYFTAVKQNAEWVATLAHLCGKSATINWGENRALESYGEFSAKGLYTVNIKPRVLAKQQEDYFSLINYDGPVYCIETETSFFLTRYEDRICVTGNTNLQNIPHDVLSYYVADAGYVIYSLDMSQIEARIVAYVGNITQMKEVYENNLDIHRMTGALIFGVPYDEVSNEHGSSSLGNGTHSQRDWSKRANHGFNYGFGYKSFSLKYEIPERQAKFIYDRYHAAYPGLKGGYWKYVEDTIKSTRTLTNLYGRKITFLGKYDDKLLNEAYSCIPQGTCGDLVNEQGLNFIYYNSDPLFKHVELLTQVHDSVSIQIPLSLPLADHARILLSIKASLEAPLRYRNVEFVVPVDLVVNLCLNKHLGIELKGDKFSNDPYVLEAYLQDAILTLGI